MNDKIYVDGAIVVYTPNFKYKCAGARYSVPPEGAETIVPSDKLNDVPCLFIKEDKLDNGKTIVKAPSFFKEYYARDFFSSKGCSAVYFSRTIDDCFNDFISRIEDVEILLDIAGIPESTQQIINRLSIVSIVASLDTLISDLVLFIATKNRESFLKTINLAVPSSKRTEIYQRIVHMWCDNTIDSAEQEVVDYVLKTSYTNDGNINSTLKTLYNISIEKDRRIETIFYWRNLIAHRNGREKNGSVITFSRETVLYNIEVIKEFASKIKDKIVKSDVNI